MNFWARNSFREGAKGLRVRQDHVGPFQEGCAFPSWKGPERAGLTESAAAPSWKELIAEVYNKL